MCTVCQRPGQRRRRLAGNGQTDGRTDGRTDGGENILSPMPSAGGDNNAKEAEISLSSRRHYAVMVGPR